MQVETLCWVDNLECWVGIQDCESYIMCYGSPGIWFGGNLSLYGAKIYYGIAMSIFNPKIDGSNNNRAKITKYISCSSYFYTTKK